MWTAKQWNTRYVLEDQDGARLLGKGGRARWWSSSSLAQIAADDLNGSKTKAPDVVAYSGKGRPSKIDDITDKQWFDLIEALELGVPYAFAAGCVGVNLATFDRWLAKGREDQEAGMESPFAEFCGIVEEAKRQHVIKAHRAIAGSDKSHKGHEWIMSRRHPEHFHQGTKVEHSGAVDGSHSVTVFDATTLDQLAEVDDDDDEENL